MDPELVTVVEDTATDIDDWDYTAVEVEGDDTVTEDDLVEEAPVVDDVKGDLPDA